MLRTGAAQDVIAELQRETGADEIVWNRRYGEPEQAVDRAIKSGFEGKASSFAGLIMHEPSQVRTGAGKPYKVYTPFWKNLIAGGSPRPPLSKPNSLISYENELRTEVLDDWKLLPTTPDWTGGLQDHWQPGEAGAAKRLQRFLKDDIEKYDQMRDLPAPDRTSRLSPHLRFGEVSPHQLWHASINAENERTLPADACEKWRKELVWREFSYHLLQEWPDLAEVNFNKAFDGFAWDTNNTHLKAWQKGQTGYPIVDAGMRQLWKTGWMHNRVRMIVGSFLVKHLLIDWKEGEKWFWDTLVDGDPASNPASWQWVGGKPAQMQHHTFRIFNPMLQTKKFDNSGTYIKKFIPELKNLPLQYIDAPWEAPPEELRKAGIILGETYPLPTVDHKLARDRALDTLNTSKQNRETD